MILESKGRRVCPGVRAETKPGEEAGHKFLSKTAREFT